MIADLQSERMDEQRAQLPGLVNRRSVGTSSKSSTAATTTNSSSSAPPNVSHKPTYIQRLLPAPDDDSFIDMLIRCQVNHVQSNYIKCLCFCAQYLFVIDVEHAIMDSSRFMMYQNGSVFI